MQFDAVMKSDDNKIMTPTHYIHDRYLDAEERYEIFVVKAAERPHLIHWSASAAGDDSTHCRNDEPSSGDDADGNDSDENEEKKVDGVMHALSNTAVTTHETEEYPPPLTDGCDLPGWRCQRIAPCMAQLDKNIVDIESPLEGTLNIGAGSDLMRRESQFPFMSSRTCCSLRQDEIDDSSTSGCWWYNAKQQFNVPPSPDRAAPIISHEEACVMVDHVTEINETEKITLFCREYEIKNRPVKVLGATNGWKAMPSYDHCDSGEKPNHDIGNKNNWRDVGENSNLFMGCGKGGWTFASLLSRFGNVAFRFSDTHGEMMSLNTYAKYITNPEGLSDDSPLGIYDSEFGDDDSPTSVLLEEYSVPECFSPDIFDIADDSATNVTDSDSVDSQEEKGRPPYRWVLIGPERSGTGMHVDPLWTNAWVTVLQGRKRWLLFPPETPYESIGMVDGKPQIPSSIWFRDFYDKVTSPSWPKEYKPVEVLQYPGETVYVPAGWPHLVLNLELTVAVTHNYASEHGPFFEKMWKEVAQDEESFALRWYAGLMKNGREDLAQKAPREIVERYLNQPPS